jgi:hypothetical protein
MDLLSQRTDRVDRNEPFDAQHLEAVDVSPGVDIGREKAMPAAMAAEEGHGPAFEFADDIGVGRIAQGRLQLVLFDVPDPLDLVQARPAENPDLGPG